MLKQILSKRGIVCSTQRGFSKTITLELPETQSYLLDGVEFDREIQTTDEEMMFIYKRMQLMRRMETQIDQLYKDRLIRGFCHMYDGQEAVLTGIEQILTWEDPIITSYRDHCHPLTRGGDAFEVIAELMGRVDGNAKGKGGSMHMYNKQANFYGGAGIVGAQIPVGTGLAFALKYLNKNQNIAIAMYGDGASNQGQLFEAANIAKLWSLPIVYLCENNLYGMGTSNARSSCNVDYYKRGDNIPGVKMDGMNVFHVKSVMQWVKSWVSKNGPLYVEALTYRYHGHSMSDPGLTYRTRDEVSQIRKNKDPIMYVKSLLLEHSIATEKEIKAIDKEIKNDIDQATKKAKESPYPDQSNLYENTYVDNDQHYFRGIEITNTLKPGGIRGTY